jgi:hypothetical protein
MPILEPDVIKGRLERPVGGSGAVKSTAPFPPAEASEFPMMFVAVI